MLGVSFHHQIVDAAAFFAFMGAWAGVAHGKSPPSPSLDRTVLIGRDERADGGGFCVNFTDCLTTLCC